MKNLFLNDEVFDFQKDYSSGLIGTLKKLSAKKVNLFVSEKIISKTDLIFILKSENIVLQWNKQLIKDEISIKNEKIFFQKKIYDNFTQVEENFILPRKAEVERITKETKIKISLNLDGKGESEITTGIGFFDHMLEQIAKHSNINLFIDVKGDLFVDEHHTVEDTGIALGECILKALGEKTGINRYGYFLPMDETIAKCAIDLGGRTYLNFKCKFRRKYIGKFPVELFSEFFRGLAGGMKANLYLRAKGENDHHKAEALFKSFARSLNSALKTDSRNTGSLPTTKGVL